ncbi:amine acid ABC transporter, permease protein, 3-TM region, His/Glu/Gln/Arg/opine family [Beggiatoa alba B18LD]|uniref:Amine acid ABC transporter, permease protein, 3-TM region, His/Glu/Gln/Arg/opine family n=1 Tax=Beggiatoa alba B18LD TaxID=395493 RepID=I3CHZ2_9GAMM|nr:amino acid ABC transporter permease [Beggiatoa alba]EIJ43235.1 amine acid ABC transporter, permease protein, 3-TM region, His/Glu/Gln/Arg/opine family [Beggiatoa alba B18LD]
MTPSPQKSSVHTMRWWHNPQTRARIFEWLILSILILFFIYIAQNTLHNLEKRGISTGFGFLSNPAGFGILQTLIPYDETDTFGRTFIVGLLNTLLVSALGLCFATTLGFIIGISRLSSNWLVAKLSLVYIETFRNIPLLLQLFFWYFAVLRALPTPRQSLEFAETAYLNVRGLYIPKPLPDEDFIWVLLVFFLTLMGMFFFKRWACQYQARTGTNLPVFWTNLGFFLIIPSTAFFILGSPLTWSFPELQGFNFRGGLVIIPELIALVVALSIYTSAFIAEIIRAGIQAVNHGQTEAAYSLGLQPRQTLRLVIIPQALRVIIPPLTSQYLNLIKNSPLATAIGYPDLVAVFAGTTLNQTGQAVEIIMMTMAVYLFISLVISALMNFYNHRIALKER